MEKLEIKTNGHWRDLVALADIPEKKRADFDYIDEDESFSPRLFCYRGEFYDSSEFITTSPGPWNHGLPEAFRGWDGYSSDSFFSGLLIKYSEDFEQVKVGLYLS